MRFYYFKTEEINAQRITKAFPRSTICKMAANKNASYSGSKVPALLGVMLKNDNIKLRNCYSINFAKSSLMMLTVIVIVIYSVLITYQPLLSVTRLILTIEPNLRHHYYDRHNGSGRAGFQTLAILEAHNAPDHSVGDVLLLVRTGSLQDTGRKGGRKSFLQKFLDVSSSVRENNYYTVFLLNLS